MQAERRTRLSPEDRRAQLVATGVAALAEHPLDAVTIEFLSAQAGVSRALVFHYFRSQAGLRRELVRTARDSMLRATEPVPELAAQARLDDTLTRIVAFVRDHRGTFYSLVRGVASGDPEVRRVVDEARHEQAERVVAVALELGSADSPLLRIALRSWVTFAEEALVESALDTDMPSEEIVAFLSRSALAVAGAVEG
ncbi:TetR/AcrR family transcriptional regulator [Schumannella sp. 10F1B-5-1]|uniref:TetR/AcrR family transcriptional regulator n=1 Tax=Schumannella sp. 10F1B-5-1 TaxID=2590780 RepID=UPI0011318E46|nr:TetR/AcrR family transcriptional regulator [Schumannella sp. 10F1B-5-1]TPW70105.1 TetR family transcriptional regulator [Schumannella sp. 10F1B-5-1]